MTAASGNMSNTLSNLFGEIMSASEELSHSGVGMSNLLSSIKNKTVRNNTHEPLDFGTLVMLMNGLRSKLNITRPSESTCNYCEGGFRDFVMAYNNIHGVFAIIVCLFGTLANALNVAVLTRRDLAAAPINRLLKWLAVADVFVMLEYVPFAVYRYLVLPGQREMPYRWAAYLLFHMHFAQFFHTASICLNISLAIWRYIAIKHSNRSHVLCTERRCSAAILCSFLLPPILGIPTYMTFDIHTAVILEPSGPALLYHVDSDEEGVLYQINFWTHAVIVKMLPCILLTIISIWLIREVCSANQHQKKLRGSNCPKAYKNVKRQCKADRRTHRTTKMLVAVLLLFLVSELPQGILGLMSGLLGKCFFKRCYNLFGELLDALALLNGAINFVLYCCMSRQFRMTFRQLVCRAHVHQGQPTTSNSEGLTTAKSSVP